MNPSCLHKISWKATVPAYQKHVNQKKKKVYTQQKYLKIQKKKMLPNFFALFWGAKWQIFMSGHLPGLHVGRRRHVNPCSIGAWCWRNRKLKWIYWINTINVWNSLLQPEKHQKPQSNCSASKIHEAELSV